MTDQLPVSVADDALLEEQESLSKVASVYQDLGFDATLCRYAYKTIKPYFVGSSCLEMGPAAGAMTVLMVDDFASLSVVDALPEFAHNAERLGPNVKGYVSLFEEFQPEETFDTIVIADVLEHVQDPVALLRRAAMWLSPGGRIIAAVPNAGSLHRRLGVKLGMLERETQLNEADYSLGHRRVYTWEHLDEHIRAADLRAVAKGGIFLKLLSNTQLAQLEDHLIDGMFELGKDLPQYCSQIYAICEPQQVG